MLSIAVRTQGVTQTVPVPVQIAAGGSNEIVCILREIPVFMILHCPLLIHR